MVLCHSEIMSAFACAYRHGKVAFYGGFTHSVIAVKTAVYIGGDNKCATFIYLLYCLGIHALRLALKACAKDAIDYHIVAIKGGVGGVFYRIYRYITAFFEVILPVGGELFA